MTQHLLVHCTREDRLAAVLREGLKPHRPRDNNYPAEPRLDDQPVGIYATPAGVYPWRTYDPMLAFAYCGPLERDPLIGRAVVVAEPIPPTAIREADASVWYL